MRIKIKNKKTGREGTSREFNTSSVFEILVYIEDDMDTVFFNEYDSYLERQDTWKDFIMYIFNKKEKA